LISCAAGAFQQRRCEAPFELADRPRQRGLCDPEPLCGPPEVQFLGDGDEVAQRAQFQIHYGRRYPFGIGCAGSDLDRADGAVVDSKHG